MENFDNNNLREKLMKLVKEHKIIVIKGLNSAQRHIVYRLCWFPLKFEKIVFNDNDENTDIRIYNCKIKQKEKKQNETSVEKTQETKNEDEYILEDSENSEEESSSVSEYENDSDDSYLTEEDDQLTRLEDMASQILEEIVNTENKINKIKSRINFVIMLNIIGWIMLYTLDPIRVIHIKTIECEIF